MMTERAEDSTGWRPPRRRFPLAARPVHADRRGDHRPRHRTGGHRRDHRAGRRDDRQAAQLANSAFSGIGRRVDRSATPSSTSDGHDQGADPVGRGGRQARSGVLRGLLDRRLPAPRLPRRGGTAQIHHQGLEIDRRSKPGGVAQLVRPVSHHRPRRGRPGQSTGSEVRANRLRSGHRGLLPAWTRRKKSANESPATISTPLADCAQASVVSHMTVARRNFPPDHRPVRG